MRAQLCGSLRDCDAVRFEAAALQRRDPELPVVVAFDERMLLHCEPCCGGAVRLPPPPSPSPCLGVQPAAVEQSVAATVVVVVFAEIKRARPSWTA